MNKLIIYVVTAVLPIDFIYAGSNPEQANKKGAAIVNAQVQNQQSQSAQGAEASKANSLNGADLSNALNAAESANVASGQQSSGAGFNMAMSGITAIMGATLIEQGLATTPAVDKMKIAMGAFMLLQSAQALSQSLNQGKTSKANRKSSGDLSTYDGLQDPNSSTNINLKGNTTGNGEDSSITSTDSKGFISSNGELSPKAQEILKRIEDAGFKVDLKDNTFTTPDGHSISLSNASNGSAVESQLNLPPGTYAKGMSLVEDIAKRQGVANNSEAGAESYSGSGNMNEGSNSADGMSGSKKSDGLSRTPASTLVAGLTSKYKGENIGVAADDIFMMVTRRYQLKHQQDSFITPEHPEKGTFVNVPRK